MNLDETCNFVVKPGIADLASDPAIAASFWRPEYLPISAWIEHIPFAFWLVATMRPSVVVELGCHYGASYFAFCQAVDRAQIDAKCYAVDTWKGDEQAGFYEEDVFRSVESRNSSLYSSFSTLIRADFTETVEYFNDQSIDLIHIDGLHTEDAVRNDVNMWLPKLSSKGVLLMHDTNVRERKFGVSNVFQELSSRYPTFEFSHGHGLGVVVVGACAHTSVLGLSKLLAQERGGVRRVFATLGNACSLMARERLAAP